MPRDFGLEVVRAAPQSKRVPRTPRHTFQIRQRPWQIQPFFIAPVLPGETMKNLLVQARCVSDPIRNPLVGWWYEMYFFYVKHRDLNDRAVLEEMHLNPDPAGITVGTNTADIATYHAGGGINWTRLCLERVTEEYFRNEGEAVLAGAIDNLPLATIMPPGQETWLDSARDATAANVTLDHELPGENPVVPDGVPAGFTNHFLQWENMRALQLTDASFEDYLKTFGITPPRELQKEELYRPELVRYIRDWRYPANTINPATGVATSAMSWSIAERADKDRFFSEPGFLFGVSVARPKVYLARLKGSLVGNMNDAYAWLPALLNDAPFTSLKQFTNAQGPLQGNVTNGYWVDIKDLFMYGDQFVNFDMADANDNSVALPAATLQRRYAAATDADSLFVDAAVSGNRIRVDGAVSLTIHSRVTDTSL